MWYCWYVPPKSSNPDATQTPKVILQMVFFYAILQTKLKKSIKKYSNLLYGQQCFTGK